MAEDEHISPVSPAPVEEEEEEKNEEVSSEDTSSPSHTMVQTYFQYPAAWEAAGLDSPVEESPSEAAVVEEEPAVTDAVEDQEEAEQVSDGGESSADSVQVDLFFHQLEMSLNQSAEPESHEDATETEDNHGTGAGASSSGANNASGSTEAASSGGHTGSVYDLPDTEWTDEDWQIWADVLRCSGKNKGQKRRLEMFRRFKYLRQSGEWVGTSPNDFGKVARTSARPKSAGSRPN